MITTLLIGWPILSILLVMLAGDKAKWAALVSTLVSFGITLYALAGFEQGPGIQYEDHYRWIPQLGITYHVGMDGISLLMVLLTNIALPLITLSSFSVTYSRPALFYSLMLLMQGSMIGVFVSFDGFLYYIFWELALIPIYFIILLWGGQDRVPITFKFFIYTLFGSLLMLVAFIYLYLQTPAPHNFDWHVLAGLPIGSNAQTLVFWAFFLAYAIKIPIFPLHTWQADTYTTAPPQGTMLLSGIMLKMGLYSVVRWLLPIAPDAVMEWRYLVIVLAIISIVYGSWIAITQNDMKRLFAYSSLAHVGLIAAGLFTLNITAMQGGMIQMLTHGINVVGLFLVAQVIWERRGTHSLRLLGGFAHQAPVFATLFMVVLLGSVALPLTNGFVGEFMLLAGLFDYQIWMSAVAGLTIILGAVYMLRVYGKVMFGPKTEDANQPFADLLWNERVVLLTIAGLVVFMGIYPKPFLDLTEDSVKALIDVVKGGSIN